MALERDYKIDASTRRCHACGREFAVGEEYYAAVVETAEEDRLQRQESCPACWKPGEGAYFSFWKTRVPQPDEVKQRGPRLVDFGRLMQVFEHLADAEDVPARRFRYVLALVLMRKRRLKVVESRRLAGGKGEELVLRETGGERRHTVLAPVVTEEEIRSVADRLRDILDMPDRWDQAAAVDSSAEALAKAEAPANAEEAGAAPVTDQPAAQDAGPTEGDEPDA
jgi:hypothetical protein